MKVLLQEILESPATEELHKKSISRIKFSPCGKMIATSSSDRLVKVYDTETLKSLYTFKGHLLGISDICWATDSSLIASASDDTNVRIWKLSASNPDSLVLQGHTAIVFCVAFHPSGPWVASGSFDENIRIWNAWTGECIRVLSAHSDPVTGVSFDLNGQILASCSYDGLVRLWDISTGECVRTLIDDKNPACSFVSFVPSANFLICGTLDSTIRIWDIKKGSIPVLLNASSFINERYCLTPCFYFSDKDPESAVVISGSENGILHIWDIKESPGSCILRRKISSNQCTIDKEDLNSTNAENQHQRPIIALDVSPAKSLMAVSVLDDKYPNFIIYKIINDQQS